MHRFIAFVVSHLLHPHRWWWIALTKQTIVFRSNPNAHPRNWVTPKPMHVSKQLAYFAIDYYRHMCATYTKVTHFKWRNNVWIDPIVIIVVKPCAAPDALIGMPYARFVFVLFEFGWSYGSLGPPLVRGASRARQRALSGATTLCWVVVGDKSRVQPQCL